MGIANTKKACAIADEIIGMCIRDVRQFRTELDIARFLLSEARKRRCRAAFPPIVASGKNAFEIHHKPGRSRIGKGFLVIDFGVRVNGDCSDMTRTVYVGKPSKKEAEAYNAVLRAQEKGIRIAKAGAECFDVDYAVRKSLGVLRQYFAHSLGHGVGKKVHQKPGLGPKSVEVLKAGDIVTIEPGIYIRGRLGIRIEDTIVVGKKCGIPLTKTSKKLILV